MRFLMSAATVLTLATSMFAQAQNNPTPPVQSDQPQADRPAGQADRPGGQADRPGGQAAPAAQPGQAPSTQSPTQGQAGRPGGQNTPSAQPGQAPSTQSPAHGEADRAGGQGTPSAQPGQPSTQSPAHGQAADRAGMAADANSRTFNGTVVNAECPQASNLPKAGAYADRSSSSSSTTTSTTDASGSSKSSATKDTTTTATKDTSTTASTSSNKNPKSVFDMQREVTRHCAANNKTTSFAVLTDDGTFYKLDDTGNTQVTSQAGGSDPKQKKNFKNMRVTVTGVPQGDTLKVQTLAKSDKPFSQ